MKRIVSGITLLALLLGMTLLAGCTAFERDITVVLKSGDELVDSATISIFRNTILPDITVEHIPDGYIFGGWAFEADAETANYEADGLLRYLDAEEYIKGNIVTLHAVYIDRATLPQPDLVVGWYAKTATSGVDQGRADRLNAALLDYLRGQGYDVDNMDIQVRGYDGDVAGIGAAINKDGDVDMLVGVGNNIDSTGGVELLEKIGDIPMGGKERVIARLTDTELSVLVFAWLQTPEALDTLA